MRLVVSVKRLLRLDSTPAAILAAVAIASGLMVIGLTSPIAAADEADGAAQAADAAPQLSERQARREQRRREREQADSDQKPDATAESARVDQANPNNYEIVVVVEPEMECKKVTVVGSRMPKEVCTPVAQQAANEQQQEQNAQDFLRRTRERQTEITEEQRNNPFLTPSAF